jgi:hypothetical protein
LDKKVDIKINSQDNEQQNKVEDNEQQKDDEQRKDAKETTTSEEELNETSTPVSKEETTQQTISLTPSGENNPETTPGSGKESVSNGSKDGSVKPKRKYTPRKKKTDAGL